MWGQQKQSLTDNKIYVGPAKAKPYRQTERRTDEVIPLWRFAGATKITWYSKNNMCDASISKT